MYRFPDPIHCIDWNRQWVAITGHIKSAVIANKVRKLVCSMHFSEEDFQGIRLKPNALPSKNLSNNPSNNNNQQVLYLNK
jgi:hypothetical protein